MRARRMIPLRLASLAAALVLAIAACGNDEDGGGTSTTRAAGAAGTSLDTVSKGKLTACSDIPYAPFEFEENGNLDGIDIEMVRAIAKELGLEAAFKDVDFDGIFSALNAGQCDIVASSVSITDERRTTLDFSEGYFEINQSLLVRKGDEGKYDDLAKLSGRTIGVQSETTGAAYAKENATGATVKEFTGADDLFTALKANQIDAVLQDLPVNAYHAETGGETVVAKVFEAEEKEQYGFAMKKGQTDLKSAIDDGLEQIRSDGTYDSILKRFLGDSPTE